MKIKSTTYYWLAAILGGVGIGTAMGAEGTAQTTGYISGTLFSVSLVLILAAVLLARLGFAAEDREKAAQVFLFSRSHKARRGGQSAADTPQKKKSLPVRQHGQAKRVMIFAAHHHKNTTICGKPQGGKT